MLQQAFALHQKGLLAEAASLYLKILEQNPQNADALHLLGMIELQKNNPLAAVQLIDRAIAVNANHPLLFHNRGVALRDLKRFDDALTSFDRALALEPEYAEALNNRGAALAELKRFDEALASYDRALALDPDYVEVLNNRGAVLSALKRFDEALASYESALTLEPDDTEALNSRGAAFAALKRFDEALASYDRALRLEPDDVNALNSRGNALQELKRFDEALASYDRALAILPDSAEALYNRGNALQGLKRFDEALASFDRALALEPGYAKAHNNRGAALAELKRFDEALASYDRALTIKPDNAEALNNRGAALAMLNHFDEAFANYDRALALEPRYAEALNNRGAALQELKRFDEALASLDRALAIKPDYAQALYNRGNALRGLNRFDEALASYDRVLAIQPDHAGALNNRGIALRDFRCLDDALASFDRALAIKPDYAEALNNRGAVLQELRRFDEALASYDRALSIRPDYPFLFGSRLHCKMCICDWHGIDDDFAQLAEKMASGKKASLPFVLLATPLSAVLQRTHSEMYIRENYPEKSLLPKFEGRYEHNRIRLGYFSADFHDHAVSYLMAGLFERHDRAKFEVIAFSFGPPTRDAMRVRLERSFDRFIEVGAPSDKDVASLARQLEIDIAIDLMGFTQNNRTGIFALRPAPVQVNYLGYPGTMGAPYIDYIIADKIVIPPGQQVSYQEEIVYLPHSYLPTDSTRAIAERTPTRAESGLPDEGFVFCCFNNLYKLTPDIFTIWMRLLANVEGSVLWLAQANPSAMRNLRRHAEFKGVAGNRICFAPFVREPDEHLARLRLADLFLDTLPYNAHTTASEALWVGLPVLTCLGQTFPGRVAASLLRAVDLPELITHSLGEYEALALELATNPQKLLSLRQKLAANRLTRPLFDTALFTRHLESAYMSMWQRHQARLAPQHIQVQP